MKKLVLISVLSLLSLNTFSSSKIYFGPNVNETKFVQNYLANLLDVRCEDVLSDEETSILVTKITKESIEQGMELEYTATAQVTTDYAHSPATLLTVEFERDVLHGSDMTLYKFSSTNKSICK